MSEKGLVETREPARNSYPRSEARSKPRLGSSRGIRCSLFFIECLLFLCSFFFFFFGLLISLAIPAMTLDVLQALYILVYPLTLPNKGQNVECTIVLLSGVVFLVFVV